MKKSIFAVFLISILWGCSTTPPPTPQNIPTVTICNQVWMTKNLDVTTYRNGDVIPQVTDPTQWENLTTGAWCYYNNDAANGPIYGKLYNWYAVNDHRGLAPNGYHIPSNDEWTTLIDCLGGELIAGGKMKEEGLTHWLSPNECATNISGFNGLPGGVRVVNNGSFSGFTGIGNGGEWWSTTKSITENSWLLYLNCNWCNLSRSTTALNYGLSVRCLKD
jgi:uncharacterized protein (TIGR02145 family)